MESTDVIPSRSKLRQQRERVEEPAFVSAITHSERRHGRILHNNKANA
jgi:hypothetical protein